MYICSDATIKTRPKSSPMNNAGPTNEGDRRSGFDRREFSYTAYLPERRSGKDRRNTCDGRSFQVSENKNEMENRHCHGGILC